MNKLINNLIQIKILAYNELLEKFDAKNKNITNISQPSTDLDAVNFLTLKEYCFKNFNNELLRLKQDINRIYKILKYTNVDELEFSKLNLEEDLREKLIYFKNLIENNTDLLNEYIFKYNSLEKKTTLLEFKKINIENQIDTLEEHIINLQKDRLSKNKLTYAEEDIKIIYNQLKEYFNSFYTSTKLNFDKIYIDINFINDKYTEINNLIISNKKKINNIILHNTHTDVIDNCLYKIYVENNNKDTVSITIDDISKNEGYIIKKFINSKIYDDVKLNKIKFLIDYYDKSDKLLKEKFNGTMQLAIDKNHINLTSDVFITNLSINKEDNFIESITIPNIFKNNKNLKYIIISINLIFKIKLL